MTPTAIDNDERLKRWRLILGGGPADGTGCQLTGEFAEMDSALGQLYDPDEKRSGGLGASSPRVARWLGDIRRYFSSSTVRVMQRDALERLNLRQMLLEPEILESVEPNVHLVSTIVSLQGVVPEETRRTARMVVQQVVDELMRKLETSMRSAVFGSLNRAARTNRPRHHDIDWQRTIRANLKHYQAEFKSIIPERLIGYARRQRSFQREVILCIDQSGSMAASIVYSSIFGAIMASLPAVRTRFVVFDTSVVDLTEKLEDPVDLLFGTQLGGGTDINGAVKYCQGLITQPANTILVLISDLFEGGVEKELLRRSAEIVGGGTQMVTLLALSDEGAPAYDAELAQKLSNLGVPSFACTPDKFPDLMAAAIQKRDISQWAADQGITTAAHPT